MSGSIWDVDDITATPSPNQLQVPQQMYTKNERSSTWDDPPSHQSFSSTTALQRDVRPSDVYANLDQVPTTNSVTPSSFFKRYRIPLFAVLGVLAAAGVAAGIAVPIILATTNNKSSSSSSSSTTTIGGSVTSGTSTPSTASTSSTSGSTLVSTSPTTSGSTLASTSVSTSPTTSGSTSPTTSGSTSASTSSSSSPSTASTSSSSPSTASTSSSSPSTASTSSSSPSTASTSSSSPSTASTSSSSPSTASTTPSTSPSTSSSSSSTVSTTPTTIATTTAPLVDPCVNGIYWNATRSRYWGTGSSGTGLNQISSPTGLFIDSSDYLYVSDSGNYRIMWYSLNVTASGLSGTVIAGATGQTGNSSFLDLFSTGLRYIYVDSSQNLYAADAYNNRVMRWASGATSGVMVAGNGLFGSTLNQTYSPYAIWVDSSSNIFVAEYQNNRITKWTPGATSGILIAGGNGAGNATSRLASPAGLYYDETNQDLYIANSATSVSTVMKWRVGDSNGTVVAGIAGSPGSASNQLKSPMGITLDQWNNLYVADRTNGRVQLFCNGSSTGITIAGSGASGTSVTSIAAPYDVKLDSRLNLYVVDNSGSRVSKFTKL